jgi:hypothetical protein
MPVRDSQWLGDGLLRGHAANMNSVIDRLARYSERQFSRFQRVPATKCHEVKRVALVVALPVTMHPSAILWRVVAVIVDTVNLVIAGRPSTHVGKETLKTIARALAVDPPVADTNATSAVVGVPAPGWVAASAFHVGPHPLRRGVGHSVLHSFWTARPTNKLVLASPTHGRFSRLQVKRKCATGSTAFAPHDQMPAGLFNDCPFTKFQIFSFVFHGV